MQIFNPNNLKNTQRIYVAIIAGIISAIVCAFVYALVINYVHIRFSLFYVAMAYGVGYSIQYFGKGADNRFIVVGIICFILSIFLVDIILLYMTFGMMNLNLIGFAINVTLTNMMNFSFNAIMDLLCIAFGFYVVYYSSRMF